ncbi:MAG: hypothetical protein K0Q97_2378 [Bacillota bacterium]|jgi:drug/metabolite transporter (DMT)-like permease|nr:hypothetical protein [Bacillota bacterium]
MEKKITPLKADLLLLIVALLWGSSYVVVKGTIDVLDSSHLIFYRFTIASILSLIFYGKYLKNATKGELFAGVFLGALLAAGIIFSATGLKYTTVSKNSFIVSINVVLVPFVYWLVSKKKPSSMSFIAVFLTFIGLAFLTLDFKTGFNINKGDLITFGCCIFYAGHIVYGEVYSKKYNPVLINTISMITAALIGVILILVKKDVGFAIPPSSFSSMMYLGVFTTFICFTLQLFAQKYTIATHAAIIISLESVFATTFAVILIGEVITLKMAVGCLFIFTSVLVSEMGDLLLNLYKTKKELKNCPENNGSDN